MSLLEQNSTRKKWVETSIELDKDNSKKYEVATICDSVVYASKSKGHLHEKLFQREKYLRACIGNITSL